MNIVQAKSEDLTPARVGQIQEFMNEGFKGEKIPRTFSPENFTRIYKTLLETGAAVLFLLVDGDQIVGLMGGVVSPDVVSTRIIAAETSWRVGKRGKGEGLNLLFAFETWAEFSALADTIVVHTRADEKDLVKLRQKLNARGYEISGFQFMRQIKKAEPGG